MKGQVNPNEILLWTFIYFQEIIYCSLDPNISSLDILVKEKTRKC